MTYRPSMQAVEAAMAAWNRAEDRPGGRGPISGPSYVSTIVEMLIAAHEVGEARGEVVMTPEQVLALPMEDNDASAKSIQEYLGKLLWELWLYKDEFSGKHPFGNSGWEYEIYKALVVGGAITGDLDEDGYFNAVDDAEGDRLIKQAIEHLMGPMEHG